MGNSLALDTPVVTASELARLSVFRLPVSAVKHLPVDQRASARVVPGLTLEQVRNCDRYGLFDNFLVKRTTQRGAWILWKPRKRGETRLYCVLDVAVARLVAWMRHSGLSMREIAVILRGSAQVRALMIAETAESVYAWRHGRAFGGVVVPEGMEGLLQPPAEGQGQWWLFPLSWLGLKSDVLPRIQKTREEHPEVWRHRWTSREQVAAVH